jgi:hypothetical protein
MLAIVMLAAPLVLWFAWSVLRAGAHADRDERPPLPRPERRPPLPMPERSGPGQPLQQLPANDPFEVTRRQIRDLPEVQIEELLW